MPLPLEPPAPTPEEKLRSAFKRARLDRRMTFEAAIANPLIKHCLSLTADAHARSSPPGTEI